MKKFAEIGAIITGDHIVYTSGKHGSAYINKDAIYPHAQLTNLLCRDIAREFLNDGVETVVGPEKGAIVLSHWTTYWLNIGRKNLGSPDVMFTYAEKSGDSFVFNRGYDKHISGKRVLVVEDLLNTGGSARKTVEAVRAAGGEVVGLGVLCNRGGVTKEGAGNVPKLFSVVNVAMEAFDPAECPLCRTGVPINTTIGHGKKFLAEQVGASA